MQSTNLLSQKSALRKAMKEMLKQINPDEKQRQTNVVLDYLLHRCPIFANSKHIALYLAMKHEEIDTIPLIERILGDEALRNQHQLYVPHIDNTINKSDMVFYQLKSLDQYKNEMNTNNKFQIKQFNDVSRLQVASPSLFDLVIVPGLAFDLDTMKEKEQEKFRIKRMGRGKGFYDRFLAKVRPDCATIGIGFNQQFLPLNETLKNNDCDRRLPVNPAYDVGLNEFLCESLINNNDGKL